MMIYNYINENEHCAVNNIPKDIALEIVDAVGVNPDLNFDVNTLRTVLSRRSHICFRFKNGGIDGYISLGSYNHGDRYGLLHEEVPNIISFDRLSAAFMSQVKIEIDSLL